MLGVLASSRNIAFLVALAFAVAASTCRHPVLAVLAAVQHPRRIWQVYGSLISTACIIVFPGGVGRQDVDDPRCGLPLVPLQNPDLSIPLAFLLGIIGTLTSSERGDPTVNAEMEVRSSPGSVARWRGGANAVEGGAAPLSPVR